MVKISAIKQQLKRQDRYSIYGDGGYLFSLSENDLITSGLKIGLELDKKALADLQDQSKFGKAYERALNLLSHRPRSEWELRDYLKRKAYDDELIQQVLARLESRGYINDKDFATRWVENRRLLKATTKRRLSQELRQKHIAEDIITQVLAADETDERIVLRELVERKRKQTKYRDNLKLMQYLSRQGFNYDDIKSIIEES